MQVNLSIKGVPEEIAERLRQRAARNHRSLQGELMAIVSQAAAEMTEETTQDDSGEPQPAIRGKTSPLMAGGKTSTLMAGGNPIGAAP
jgi:hypothetical protein